MSIEEKIASLPFEPLALWVVIERDPEKEQTKGGLEIPNAYRHKTNRGTVLAVGNGMSTDYGVIRTINEKVKPGAVIQWDGASYDIEVQGQFYTFIPSSVIVLVEKEVS